MFKCLIYWILNTVINIKYIYNYWIYYIIVLNIKYNFLTSEYVNLSYSEKKLLKIKCYFH